MSTHMASAAGSADELRALMLASQRFRQAMADRFSLSLSEMVALGHLAGATDGLTPRDLAQGLLLQSGTLTAVIDRLDAKGYARREPNPADRRSSVVRLTSAGRRIVRYVEGRLDTVLAATDQSVDSQRQALVDLAAALDREADRLARMPRRSLGSSR